ncbi:MAG: hypothetical protein KGD73_10555 [Candidatus Lokiarchaeota archaeon]|nr:hypothetical protein [Candidatus Lokiarchaeota archaeon]
MPIGLLLMQWDPKVGTDIIEKYPEELTVSDETLMQIYASHEYSEEPGMISLFIGHLNLASFYTGREKSLYIVLILHLDEDADAYEGGLSDISRIILQHYDDDSYIDMIPFLFQRLSAYPILNQEQIIAITYQDEVNRLLINRLREEGVVSKSELKIWLKDRYRRGFFDIDATLNELIRKEIIKETSVKGIPSELIFFINDIFIIRRPPVDLLKESEERGLPNDLKDEYKVTVKKWFENYQISEEDNLALLDIITDPQIFEVLKLLRIAIVTKNALMKLKKKGVEDIDECLKKLWEANIVHVFQDNNGNEYYALLSNPCIFLAHPKFILSTIIHQYDVKSKSEPVLIEYLKVLDDNYSSIKIDIKNED